MEVLTGQSRKEPSAKDRGKAEHAPDKKRPAPPPPQLNMGGMRISPMRAPQQSQPAPDKAPGKGVEKTPEKQQEKEQARERMRALLKQQREYSRERSVGRE